MSTGIDNDPTFWKWLSGIILGVMSIPMGWLFKKVTNAASKEELAEAIKHSAGSEKRILGMIEKLFENAENDRRRVNDNLSKLHSNLHDMHIDLIDRINRAVTHGDTKWKTKDE